MAAALLIGGCAAVGDREAADLLNDIAAGGAPSVLRQATPAPTRATVSWRLSGRAGLGDLYSPGEPARGALVLVPGLTPHGRADPRLTPLAESLARVRFLVLVPELPGARALRASADDARPIADAALRLDAIARERGLTQGIGLAAISYAVGPTVLAALEPDVGPRVSFVFGLGGYHDTTEAVRFATTGAFRESPGQSWQRRKVEPAARWFFIQSNASRLAARRERDTLTAIALRRRADARAPIDDLSRRLGPDGAATLELAENDDPERVPALIAALPAALQREFTRLSLAGRDLSPLTGKLILLHGTDDDTIPWTESARLAAAVPGTTLVIAPGFSHIDPRDIGFAGRLALLEAAHALLERRDRPR